MRKISIFAFGLTIFLFSCNSRNAKQQTNNGVEIPEALQEESSYEIKVRSYESNLVEELYQELVEKDSKLQKLEEDLSTLDPKANDLKNKFNTYDGKSKSYYRSSNGMLASINDSVLRKKMSSIIAKSESKYSQKTVNINSLINQMDQQTLTIADYHSVFKITLTLPIIEKYQKDNIPLKKEFKDFTIEQKNYIKKLMD